MEGTVRSRTNGSGPQKNHSYEGATQVFVHMYAHMLVGMESSRQSCRLGAGEMHRPHGNQIFNVKLPANQHRSMMRESVRSDRNEPASLNLVSDAALPIPRGQSSSPDSDEPRGAPDVARLAGP